MASGHARLRRACGGGGERSHGDRQPAHRESRVAVADALDEPVALEPPKRGLEPRLPAAGPGADAFEVGAEATVGQPQHGAKDVNVVSHDLTLRGT